MDFLTDYNGYYVALIIITIVTIAISIALSFYFIFIPSIRIENEFNRLESRGTIALQEVTNLVNMTTNLSDEVLQETCESIIYAANVLFGFPRITNVQGCLLATYPCPINPFIPAVCQPFIASSCPT